MSEPLLSFRITKRHPGFTLECEATFDAGVTAVFGPSGSGKTTLLNCIAGLAAPDDGEITVLGETIYSSETRRKVPPEKRRFGYVFQDSALFPHMSVWGNIRYGHALTPPERRRIDPEQLVDLFQLSGLLDRRVANLSGGERQRTALARALATSPRLLLLDEPLASLDVAFRGVIIRYLKRIRRELQTPMVYVSHSMSEVIALADDVLVLSGGKRVAQAMPSQVLAHPGLGTMANYPTLQNLLEAEVLPDHGEDGLVLLDVGGARLLVPEVFSDPGETVTISISAGDIIIALEQPPKMSARNVVRGVVEEVHEVGPRVLVYLNIGTRLMVEITLGSLRDLGLRPRQEVYAIIKSTSIMVLEAPGVGAQEQSASGD